MTLGDLSELLSRRRAAAITGAVVAFVVVLVVAFTRTPLYQASASLSLDRSQRSLAARLDPASAPVAEDLVSTQRELLLSKDVLENALASAGAEGPAYRQATDPIDLLRRRLKVVAVREAWVVTLALTDEDPHRAERLLGAVLTAYREVHLRRGQEQDRVRLEALRRQVEEARDALAGAEEEVRSFRAANGIVSTHPQDNHIAYEVNQLARQRAESAGRLAEAQARADQVRDALAQTDPEERRVRLLSLSGIAQQRSIVELAPRLTAARADRAQLAEKFGPKHPRMIQSEAEVAALQQLYDATILASAEGILAEARQAEASHQAAIARLTEAQARATAYAEALLHLARREENRQTLEKVHQELLQRYHQQMAAGRIEDVPLSVADAPTADRAPQGLSKAAWLAIAVAAALAAGAAVAILREVFDGRIRDRLDLERRHGLPVLGELPWAPPAEEGDLDGPTLDPAVAEALRSIRAALPVVPTEAGQGRVYLVTSAGGGDGRTSTALGLALILADAGVRVLLVDGDLRMPSLDVVFSQPTTPGLTQVLLGEADIATRATNHPNLALMPAGGTPSNPAELLSGHCLREWLDFCRPQFDLILIDGPPAEVPDAIELARFSDALLIAVRAGWTRRPELQQALHTLAAFRPRVLGAILLPAG